MNGWIPVVVVFESRFEKHHGKELVPGESVFRHLSISGLENVERQYDTWEENDVG
jgi:hypothetical protein